MHLCHSLVGHEGLTSRPSIEELLEGGAVVEQVRNVGVVVFVCVPSPCSSAPVANGEVNGDHRPETEDTST